jgi:hypothetical protein
MVCKRARLLSFIGFRWVGLARPLENFRNFDGNYRTNLVTDKTIGKTSILFSLPFLEDIAIFISDTDTD